MDGAELADNLRGLSTDDLMREAAAWISDSLSAHYECGGTAPSEGLGKRLCAELYTRTSAHLRPATKTALAVSALYMWKLRSPHRRVSIDLNAMASEGHEPAAKVVLQGPGEDDNFEGYGATLPEAVNDALGKDGSGA